MFDDFRTGYSMDNGYDRHKQLIQDAKKCQLIQEAKGAKARQKHSVIFRIGAVMIYFGLFLQHFTHEKS